MTNNVVLIKAYFNALSKGDFATVASLMSDNLVWHQPGQSCLSGDISGKESVFAHLGEFSKLSEGTFKIDSVEYIADNGNLVVASIHFGACVGEQTISMKGMDLFRIENGKIQEVWLFSEDIEAEDSLWGITSNKM